MPELKKESNIISPYIKEFMTESSIVKNVALTIGERLAAIKIFDGFKGSISVLATIMDDVKVFPVIQEEWQAANLKKVVLYKLTDANGKETKVTKDYGSEDEGRAEFEASENTEGKTGTVENESWKWDEVAPKEMELKTDTVEYLLSEIKKKDEAKEITIADLPLISLQTKLTA